MENVNSSLNDKVNRHVNEGESLKMFILFITVG